MSYLTKNYKPVLQIIHVSDLHTVASMGPIAPRLVNWCRFLRKVGLSHLADNVAEGIAPDDTFAPIMFKRFIERITMKDDAWKNFPSWLIDTGDQTTYGDEASFTKARKVLTSSRTSGSLVNLHGNHDAWPSEFPLFARSAISSHTSAMKNPPWSYAVGTAQAPLRTKLSTANAEIQLYTLDTVNDSWLANTRAQGFVHDSQLDQLDQLMQANQGTSAAKHLRILATHHPIHFPSPPPFNYCLVIKNSGRVGQRLYVKPPFVHLVLSGHIHKLFPEHGKLPNLPRMCQHSPLGLDQCQLVVGTLKQLDRLGKRGDHPHQCEVLRFFQDPREPDQVILQRLLAARNPYANPPRPEYDFVPLTGNPGALAEEMVIAL